MAGPVGGFPGGGPSARSTTRCTVVVGSGFLPGLRVLSPFSPALQREFVALPGHFGSAAVRAWVAGPAGDEITAEICSRLQNLVGFGRPQLEYPFLP